MAAKDALGAVVTLPGLLLPSGRQAAAAGRSRDGSGRPTLAPEPHSELMQCLRSFKGQLLAVAVFSLVLNLLHLTPTIYMLQIYDRVLASGSALTLLVISVIVAFLFAALAFTEWVRSRLLVRFGARLDETLSSRVFNASFDAYLTRAGRSPIEAFTDLTALRQFITGHGVSTLFDLPWIPIYFVVLYWLHPLLGAFVLAFGVIHVISIFLRHRLDRKVRHAAGKDAGQPNARLHSLLRNAESIEALGMLARLRQSWAGQHRYELGVVERSQGKIDAFEGVTKYMGHVEVAFALALAAWLVIQGELSIGGLIAANLLTRRALAPISSMVGAWTNFENAAKAFRRLDALLLEFPGRAKGVAHAAPRGELRVLDLVADAPGRREPILRGISAHFSAGRVVVVMGPSGSGKSTLARCLLGIWPDVQGSVLLDRQSIASWNRDELGAHIGYLPQDIELFDGTIAENIARFGEIDSKQLIEATTRAGIHDLILRFPRGYETPMGEAGSFLSGGQQQRIGLARALYGDPALLVLDEPNANLDEAGDLALLQAIRDQKARGKTVILISHRKNAIEVADDLLVLRDGYVQHFGPREGVLVEMKAMQAQAEARQESMAAA